jgi:hypothetical protein
MSQTTPTSAGLVDTAKVGGRRTLRFDSIDQALAEADRLVEAERAGRLRRLGNWTLGQTLGHLACWVEFGFNGVPLKPPFFIRWIMRFRKRKFLTEPMQAGVKIPGVEGGTLATAAMPLDEAVGRWRRAMERLKVECPSLPNVIFGPLTHDEWIALNLRHAELHLSFFVPDPAPQGKDSG